MMEIYLVRHGIAVDAANGEPDELRPLTDTGRRRFRKVARKLGKHVSKLDLILTSPLVRAVQTAEILAGEVKHAELSVLPELNGEHPAQAALAAVAKRAHDGDAIALVGHEPQMTGLIAALGRLSPADAARLDFRKGAVVRVDASGLPATKAAEPRWWIKPRTATRQKGLPFRDLAATEDETGKEPGGAPSARVSVRKS
jgi:phosphohistidine phosphatase